MLTGQMYRVGFTGIINNDQSTKEIQYELAVVGSSCDDVRTRFTFMFDVSEYDRYRIDFVIKEPDRYVVLHSQSRSVKHSAPDAVIKRNDRSETVVQKLLRNHSVYRVAVSTAIRAGDEKHARKKLIARINDNSDDERLLWIVDNEQARDPMARARDVSVFPRAHVIRA